MGLMERYQSWLVDDHRVFSIFVRPKVPKRSKKGNRFETPNYVSLRRPQSSFARSVAVALWHITTVHHLSRARQLDSAQLGGNLFNEVPYNPVHTRTGSKSVCKTSTILLYPLSVEIYQERHHHDTLYSPDGLRLLPGIRAFSVTVVPLHYPPPLSASLPPTVLVGGRARRQLGHIFGLIDLPFGFPVTRSSESIQSLCCMLRRETLIMGSWHG